MLSVFKSVPLRYMGLDWLSNGVSISEAPVSQKIAPTSWSVAGEFRPRHLQRKQVVVGLRSTRKFGIPQPWRPAGSRLGKKIPWFSEGCHIFGVAETDDEAPSQAVWYCWGYVPAGNEQVGKQTSFNSQSGGGCDQIKSRLYEVLWPKCWILARTIATPTWAWQMD